MHFIENCGVNVSLSVIVSGVTNTESDEEIIDCLKRYGSIKTNIYVDDPKSIFYKNLIVEYTYQSAITALIPLLPYTYPSTVDPDLTFYVKLLASECPATAGVRNPPDYINQLKIMADHSGENFEDVLKEVMSQLSEHLEHCSDLEEEASVQIVETTPSLPGQQGSPPEQNVQPVPAPSHSVPDQQGSLPRPQRLTLSASDLNPTEIQKVVVEHIVKTDDLSAHALPSFRIRPFSGKSPRPNNETDYETWKSHIELLLADPNLPPRHVTRRILESLFSPAADVVRGLGPDTFPKVYLEVLDSAYATVKDGDELFAQFLNTQQDPGEKPSAYLQRLQLTLHTVVKRGGISSAETDKHLLKQFCRGCWDPVIDKLQLELKKSKPPSFSELLLMLRTEEDRQLTRENLMKKHLTASKQRVHVHSQSACSCGHPDNNKAINELKQQMQKLQSQLSALLAQRSNSSKPVPAQNRSLRPEKPAVSSSTSTNRPRPGYCFKCGEDGHMSASCNNTPNPTLVQQKKRLLQQKQQAWDNNNNQSN